MSEADDILAEGKRLFALAEAAETDNRQTALEDIRFAREGVQWPDDIRKARERKNRPILTINKMPAFIRQVVNDARQNKPSIKVHPADSGADPETAEVLNGLIRNIEYTSNADVAYDTGIECAVSGGFGYWRVVTDYAYHDSFDMDLRIERVANPFSVYGDPYSKAADSSDWMNAFVTEYLSKEQFEARFGEQAVEDWDDTSAWGESTTWLGDSGKDRLLAEWWNREEAEEEIAQTADGRVYSKTQIEQDEDVQFLIQQGAIRIVKTRKAKVFKVKQRFMSGTKVLKEVAWPGCYIPIIPVYGDEFDIKGKRHLRSLIHNAVDAQRMFNYWRTNATELVALAPRVPFIGRKGTFDADIEKWQTANTESHAYLEFDSEMPQRQPMDTGAAAGSLQEALNASDDMKAVMGIYDASLGARSNETSGRAIMARQREGDVATFHFIDNLSRAIRHTGRVLIDLIPHVYSGARMVRVMGEDGQPRNVQLGQEYQKTDPKTGAPMHRMAHTPDGAPIQGRDGHPLIEPLMAIHDLSAGKYDLTVTTGPSFTTRREEAAFQMTEMIRALPQSAPILGKHLAKNLDWPGADEIAEELDAMSQPQVPPELQQQIEEGQKRLQALEQENQQLKADKSVDIEAKQAELQMKMQVSELEIQSEERIAQMKIESEARIAAFKARLMAEAQAARPQIVSQAGAANGIPR